MFIDKKREKKIIIILLIINFIFMLIVPAQAASYSLYGSVNSDTSQVSLLIDYLTNDNRYKIGDHFIIARTGEYEYICFFGDLPTSYNYIEYYRYSISQYATNWQIRTGSGSNLSINTNNYTYVGDQSGGLLPIRLYSNFYYRYNLFIIPAIAVIVIFFTFRPKKGVSL